MSGLGTELHNPTVLYHHSIATLDSTTTMDCCTPHTALPHNAALMPGLCCYAAAVLQAKGMAEGTLGTAATLVGGLVGIAVLAYLALNA